MRWFRLFGKMFFELSNYQLIKKRIGEKVIFITFDIKK